ncbi:SdiA-regulated domain-containing protein [Azonexus sp.]|uniref:SdiA-regulated domain-containing protein n=1 Tax=Azonexus sp. TaxID=1872668 RepID=UPI0035B279E1
MSATRSLSVPLSLSAPRLRRPHGGFLLAILLVLAGAALFGRWPLLVLHWQQVTADAGQRERAAWLPDYRVDIEARPLAGVAANLSGLTYDPDRRSLFAITNASPEIIELSLSGEVLRRIPLSGVSDPEAIEYVGPGEFVLTDERRQALVHVRIDAGTRAIDGGRAPRLALGIGRNGNKGFEGLAFDAASGRMFVAKERDPQRIYEVRGFPYAATATVDIAEDAARDAALPGTDLAGLHFDAASGHLLALSEESRLLVEFATDGRPLSSLSLAAGRSGLQKAIPQAEGVTLDDQGRLYVVSEPNLFYRFTRQPPASPAD